MAKPSLSFKAFEDEANRFEIRPGAALDLRFDAKQRMIARAEGFAIREAFLISPWKLFFAGALRYYRNGIEGCEKQIASSEAAATHPKKLDGDDQRHRAEICLNLHARTIQQIVLRRLYLAAVCAAVIGIVVSILSLSR